MLYKDEYEAKQVELHHIRLISELQDTNKYLEEQNEKLTARVKELETEVAEPKRTGPTLIGAPKLAEIKSSIQDALNVVRPI